MAEVAESEPVFLNTTAEIIVPGGPTEEQTRVLYEMNTCHTCQHGEYTSHKLWY
jgi:hypothetical protein